MVDLNHNIITVLQSVPSMPQSKSQDNRSISGTLTAKEPQPNVLQSSPRFPCDLRLLVRACLLIGLHLFVNPLWPQQISSDSPTSSECLSGSLSTRLLRECLSDRSELIEARL